MINGPAMGLSATYHHGKDRDRVYGGRGYGRGRGSNRRHVQEFPGLPRWWWADPRIYIPTSDITPNPQNEIAALEESKKDLGEEKASIEQEITKSKQT